MTVIRIGVLGASRIAPFAVINPARKHPEVEVTAVAARELSRAQRFAARHAIPQAYGSYADLLTDPAIDAVYIGLPNALHGQWIAAALDAGKHVLCEKPLAANAEEAATVAELVAARADLVVMEAFHYRYHPLTARMLKIIESGELGTIERLEASFCFPVPPPGNIRWSYELAGGALMDAGVYPIHLLRTLTGAEPEVVAAEAQTRRPDVDRVFRAALTFPSGTAARITTSLWSRRIFSARVVVVGSAATMDVMNPFLPHVWHRLVLRTGQRRQRTEYVPRRPSTYTHQLRAFADAVLRGAPVLTSVSDAIATMRVIDACYAAAGLPRREPR